MRINEISAKAPKPKFPLKTTMKIDKSVENMYKQPLCKVGDFVFIGSNRVLSSGTVGKVIDIIQTDKYGVPNETFAKVLTLDGKENMVRPYICGVGDHDMIEQVKDYYINVENRPDRVVEKDM